MGIGGVCKINDDAMRMNNREKSPQAAVAVGMMLTNIIHHIKSNTTSERLWLNISSSCSDYILACGQENNTCYGWYVFVSVSQRSSFPCLGTNRWEDRLSGLDNNIIRSEPGLIAVIQEDEIPSRTKCTGASFYRKTIFIWIFSKYSFPLIYFLHF